MEGQQTIQAAKGGGHVALLEKYPKAVSFVKDLISEHLAKQQEKGETWLVSPLICLQPHDVTRSLLDDEADWPKFEQVTTEAGVLFCESETVEQEDMPGFVQALLWDFRTNGQLSLEVQMREICCESYDGTPPADIYIQELEAFPTGYPSMIPLFQFTWAKGTTRPCFETQK